MDCIFNELSAQPVGTVTEAFVVMELFVKAVGEIQGLGMKRVRIPEELGQNLFSLPLAPVYTIGSWLNDERVNRDLKDRFRLIVANPPLLGIDDFNALILFDHSVFCLAEAGGKPEARGFGASYLSDKFLLSTL